MAYDDTLRRVRLLLLAQSAVSEALESAMNELAEQARAEGKPTLGMTVRNGRLSLAPTPPPPIQSGLHPRFEGPVPAAAPSATDTTGTAGATGATKNRR